MQPDAAGSRMYLNIYLEVIIRVFLQLFRRTTPTRALSPDGDVPSQTARGDRTYRRAYLAISNADGPEVEAFDRLNGPTHSNTPRCCNRPSGVRPSGVLPETES